MIELDGYDWEQIKQMGLCIHGCTPVYKICCGRAIRFLPTTNPGSYTQGDYSWDVEKFVGYLPATSKPPSVVTSVRIPLSDAG